MATSTLRGLILVALVVLGIVGLTKLFPTNASVGVTPAASSVGPSPSTPSFSPTVSQSPAGRKPRPKGKVTIQVLNGTSRAFFAALQTDVLKKDGYKTATPGNYTPRIATTIIYYQPNSLPEAERLKRQRFPSAALKPAPPTLDSNVDLQVILGQDVAGG
ncbi:MAG TPA: LytR C-terminal domain-containing protein [Actinomycetota bacterium]